ncbi:ribonuclease H-like domain-containing protein [Tanacetum coccineum]
MTHTQQPNYDFLLTNLLPTPNLASTPPPQPPYVTTPHLALTEPIPSLTSSAQTTPLVTPPSTPQRAQPAPPQAQARPPSMTQPLRPPSSQHPSSNTQIQFAPPSQPTQSAQLPNPPANSTFQIHAPALVPAPTPDTTTISNTHSMVTRAKDDISKPIDRQQHGIDYDETFSPVVKPTTIRIVLSIDVSRNWPIHQLDVKNAFLHGHLSKTIYMHQPSGFVDPHILDYHSYNGLHGEFSMTDLGSLNYFLGISVERSSTSLFLSQSTYAEEILELAHMQKCNPYRTSVDTKSKLGADGDPISDPTLYQSLVGTLQYLTFTHPDISNVVHQVCLYMHDPREPHLAALKPSLSYCKFRSTSRIWFKVIACCGY